MKNIILKLVTAFLFLPFLMQAQTLKIEQAEYAFSLNKDQFLDTLNKAGFKYLSDKEIEQEDFANSTGNSRPNTKERIYSKNGIRKEHELRKIVYGGECRLSIIMKEPQNKLVEKLYWNANLQFDAGYYVRKFDQLGYKRVIENNLEKYVNKEKGVEITLKISRQTNEIIFMMSRVT